MMLRFIAMILMATPVAAQEFPTRGGDEIFDTNATRDVIVEKSHEFYDGGVSFYSISVDYSYTYPDGGRAFGRYELGEDGVVCTFFRHGFERCDLYVQDARGLVLITQDSDRFLVR